MENDGVLGSMKPCLTFVILSLDLIVQSFVCY